MTPPPATAAEEPALFDALLQPHRSLSPRAFRLVMGGIAACAVTVALYFTLGGAWMVLPFFGYELVLLWWACRASLRSARLYERVRLVPDRLTVRRVQPGGQSREWDFQPYWLRVEVEEHPSGDNRLWLSSHGRSLAIGAFLSPPERRSFAEALRDALRGVRTGPAV